MTQYTRPYIAGPMRGIKWYNFPAFDAMRDKQIALGRHPICPSDLDRRIGFDAMSLPESHDWNSTPEGFSIDACVKRDVDALSKADSIILLDGWEKSTGARAEVALAKWYGIPRIDPLTGEPIAFELETEQPKDKDGVIRTFGTGATRSQDSGRDDPEGYLSPLAIDRFNQYMTLHRVQADGNVRASDNWQKGLPLATYMKGLWRHFLHLWTRHRGFPVRDTLAAADLEEDLCALFFNVQGYLHEVVKARIEKQRKQERTGGWEGKCLLDRQRQPFFEEAADLPTARERAVSEHP